MLRLFVGTFVSSADRERVAAFQRANGALKESGQLRWTGLEELHLTWRFVEAVREECLPELKAAIAASIEFYNQEHFTKAPKNATPLPTVSFDRAALWPGTREPRLLVLQPDKTCARVERLSELFMENTRNYSSAKRVETFKPHLTIARMSRAKEGSRVLTLDDFVELSSLTQIKLDIESVELILSQPGPGAHTYKSVENFSVNKLDKA